MSNSYLSGWPAVWLDMWALSVEAAAVVRLRLRKIARGGAAGESEARLMVSEKVLAAMQVQASLGADLITSPLSRSQTVLSHYGFVVRANRLRLSL